MWVNGKAPSHMALHDRENQPVRREPEEDASYCSRTRAILIDQEADYINYLSADLSAPDAMVKMDITDIQYPDNTFDVIYCSHVLEHLQDDRKAMGEFYRVLKPGCWAILQVPITADTTFEDPTVISPKERSGCSDNTITSVDTGPTIRIGLWRQASRLWLMVSYAS
jgi:SAM-dependent methyltransferase